MPIFDFNCTKCNTITEKIVKTEVTSTICPHCGGEATKVIVSAPKGFILKGEGFYKPSVN